METTLYLITSIGDTDVWTHAYIHMFCTYTHRTYAHNLIYSQFSVSEISFWNISYVAVVYWYRFLIGPLSVPYRSLIGPLSVPYRFLISCCSVFIQLLIVCNNTAYHNMTYWLRLFGHIYVCWFHVSCLVL